MFSARELSRFGGQPIRLFTFQRQALVWRYASCEHDIVVDGNTYLAAQIERDEVQQTVERAKDTLKIRMAYLRDPSVPEGRRPSTQSLGDNWHPYTPSDSVYVTCAETHYGETDPPSVNWRGVVAQAAFTDIQMEMTCFPGAVISEARNQGAKFQRACWKSVYSTGLRGCNLDPDTVSVTGELTAVDGLTLTAAEFATSAFPLVGGDVQWTCENGIVERRSIMSESGSTITILYDGPDLAVGVEVTARPSCPQTWSACTERDNTVNFGGAIYKPVNNPKEESMSWG